MAEAAILRDQEGLAPHLERLISKVIKKGSPKLGGMVSIEDYRQSARLAILKSGVDFDPNEAKSEAGQKALLATYFVVKNAVTRQSERAEMIRVKSHAAKIFPASRAGDNLMLELVVSRWAGDAQTSPRGLPGEVVSAINGLTARQKEALSRVFGLDGQHRHTQAEAAEAMKMSKSALRTLVGRGLEAMRRRLTKDTSEAIRLRVREILSRGPGGIPAHILAAIERLPQQKKESLCRVYGLGGYAKQGGESAAMEMGISSTTVRNYASRAISIIGKQLSCEHPSPSTSRDSQEMGASATSPSPG